MSKEPEKKQKLTRMQELFVENYLLTFNASDAARKAGYSEKCSKEQGYRLLTLNHIKETINFALEEAHCRQKRKLIAAADSAIFALVDTIQKGKGLARVQAANSVLDRSGHKTEDRFSGDINANIKGDINYTDVKPTLLSKLFLKFNKRGNDGDSGISE